VGGRWESGEKEEGNACPKDSVILDFRRPIVGQFTQKLAHPKKPKAKKKKCTFKIFPVKLCSLIYYFKTSQVSFTGSKIYVNGKLSTPSRNLYHVMEFDVLLRDFG